MSILLVCHLSCDWSRDYFLAPPPLLFETCCNPEVGVTFGGSPFVYLHNSKPTLQNEFQINLLKTGKLVSNRSLSHSLSYSLALSLSLSR